MFRGTTCPSSGETTMFMRHLVLVILCGWLTGMHARQSSIENNKHQVSHKHSCFSWWWTHNHPKHVEIDKYTKNKLCTVLALFTIIYRDVGQQNIKLFHQPTLMPEFVYSLTICLLHYYPRHVSSINMPIFRRKNRIHTASGILALINGCTLHRLRADSALNRCAVQPFTESEDSRCCVNTFFHPEDGHVSARNMSRIIV